MQSLGIQNGVAYRTMNKMMTTLAAPQVLTDAQVAGLKALGVTTEEMAARMKKSGSGGIQFFLEKVKAIAASDPQKALGAIKQLMGADFGDEVLTSALAVDKFSQALKYAGDDAGNLAKFQGEVEKKLGGSAGQIQIFQANLTKIGIVIGTAILPALNQVLTAIIPVLNQFGRFAQANPRIVQTGVVILGVVAAIAPLLIAIGSVISAVGTIAGAVSAAIPIIAGIGGAIATVVGIVVSAPVLIGVAIAAAVGAIVAGGYAIYKNWDWLRRQASSIWNGVGSAIYGAVGGVYNAVKSAFAQIGNYVLSFGNWAIKTFSVAGSNLMIAFANGIQNAASYPFKVIQDFVGRIRAYLPGSDAKVGALSDLTASGRALSQTFAVGMGDTKAITSAVSRIASAATPKVTAPALAGTGTGGSSTVLNFQPTINLSGSASESDGRKLIEQMDLWATEIIDILDRNRARNNRR
jgi:phage-related protein